MHFVGYKYHRVLKFCFFVMGLTSYKPTHLRVVHTTIVYLTLLLGSTFFVLSLDSKTCTFQLSSLRINVAILIAHVNITYGLLLVKSINMEEWLRDMKRDWNCIQDKEEFKILKTHVAMENRYINIYLSKK
ncbi:uncharacterized protein LOC122530875 [Frieseomelitta varia]|uniref:uncharacterized protein LOC122530875 n=1 Tax=Frieseomelitta varia TaxID=561572 RepID=UPI001CB68CED|nr:uncharacterized protein LOC122530875 [Frieseomelitta varia]